MTGGIQGDEEVEWVGFGRSSGCICYEYLCSSAE